jgi:hypothetical protein
MLSHSFEHNAISMMTLDHMDTQVLDEIENESSAVSEQEDSWSLAQVFGLDNCCGVLFAGPSAPPTHEVRPSSENNEGFESTPQMMP